jgi:glycerophosphoryl diester phosphodiesterase
MNHAGIDGIECDVRLTEDDIIVIHHDPHLEDGRFIASVQWIDIPQYVPTLHDLLRRASRRGYQGLINLEIKTYNTTAKVVKVLQEFADTIRPEQILLSSFLHTEVNREQEDKFARGIIMACQPSNTAFDKLTAHQQDKLILRDCVINWADPTTALLLECVAPKVFLWTVNQPERIKELRQKGFNVITDVLPFIDDD